MLLVTITNWKRKLAVICRFLLFLLLIGLIIPQFLTYIAGELVDLKSRSDASRPPAMRVEREAVGAKPAPEPTFLEKLRQFYYGESAGSPHVQD